MKPNNRYERKAGSRAAIGEKKRTISFSFEKLDCNQGQSLRDWETFGLLAQLCQRIQQVGQYETKDVLALQMIKQYTKVNFPPNSKFTPPKHVSPANWAVMHITPTSKEVVAGYVEMDVFYIVFLDKEHNFWPTDIQSRGKNKR